MVHSNRVYQKIGIYCGGGCVGVQALSLLLSLSIWNDRRSSCIPGELGAEPRELCRLPLLAGPWKGARQPGEGR